MRKTLEEIEKALGHPDDDMGQRTGHDALYGTEREGFDVGIKAVDSDNLRQALTYLRALFPEEKK